MPILQVLITLVIAGVMIWLNNSYIPMDGKIKKNSQRGCNCFGDSMVAECVWSNRFNVLHTHWRVRCRPVKND